MLADHRLAACLHGLLAASLLLVCSCEDAGAGREKNKKKDAASPVAALVAGAGNCKAPAPVDERLAKGLALYLEGEWQSALAPLQAWSGSEGADRDPAAGRGYYSLGYALTATRRPQLADAWNAKAEPLLASSAETSPNLEDLYYLASLHRTRRETGKQLDTVSKALALLEAGTLCPATDGDDDFRVARLLSFAGREAEKAARLEQAVAKYARGLGRVVSYRALALQELGEAARQIGRASGRERV